MISNLYCTSLKFAVNYGKAAILTVALSIKAGAENESVVSSLPGRRSAYWAAAAGGCVLSESVNIIA